MQCCWGRSAIHRFPITSRSGRRFSRSGRGSTCGRTFVLAACCAGIPTPLAGREPRRRGLPGRARKHRGRVRGGWRTLAPKARLRGGARDERLHAGRRTARRPLRLRTGGVASGDVDECDEVERVAVRLRALGRGGRGDGRGIRRACASSGCWWTRSPRAWCAIRPASTSSSHRTCSATSSPTSPPRCRAAWAWPRAQTSPRAPTSGRVRARARLGARHRRGRDRQPGGRDLERLAHAGTSGRGRGRQ